MFASASGSNQRHGIVAALMVFMFSVMTTRPAGSAQTSLTLHSETGDPVGNGYDYFYTTSQGTFSVQRNTRSGVTVTFTTYSGLTWSMQFAAPGNQPLVPGVWLDAVTFSSNDPSRAGIQVTGFGRSCAAVTGTIQVKQITYGATGNVTAFWAVFSQRCSGSSAVITGDLRYRTDLPVYVTAPPCRSAIRGEEVYFDVLGTSALSAVTLTAAGLPDGANFWDDGGGYGSFDWFTAPTQVGRHVMTFYARNAANAIDSTVSVIDVSGVTGFRAESDADDTVGQGIGCDVSSADAAVSAREENGTVTLSVQTNSGSSWNLTFAGDGVPLAIGNYPNALAPGSGSGHPGLSVTLDGRACSSVSGEFEVRELVRDERGLQSFRAVFEQRCGTAVPAMRGDIRFNAGVPIDVRAPLEMTVDAGQDVTFFVMASDPSYNPLTLSAAAMPAGASFADMGDNSGVFTWTPGQAQGGSYHIAFTAANPNGRGEETATTRIVVRSTALPPVAEAGGPFAATPGDLVLFDGSGSTSPDGSPLNYTWNFGDGTTATGVTAEHGYAAPGTFAVVLTVCTDVFCSSDSTAAVIAPGDVLPGKLIARAFTAAGANPLRLDNQRPEYSIYFEPVGFAWTLDQVDPASVTLASQGTGTIDLVHAISVHPTPGTDRDKNGVADLEAVFQMADMRQLVGNVPNHGQVSLLVSGLLANGARIECQVSIEVYSNGGGRGLSAGANSRSEIRFTVDQPGFVRVRLYDLSGRMIGTLMEQDVPAGEHAVQAHGNHGSARMPQGVYFYQVEMPNGMERGRVVVMR